MNRSNIIESLEGRQLFSSGTAPFDHSYLPPAASSLAVAAIDINQLGLHVSTSPIDVRASAQSGDGKLLGNVLTAVTNGMTNDGNGVRRSSPISRSEPQATITPEFIGHTLAARQSAAAAPSVSEVVVTKFQPQEPPQSTRQETIMQDDR